MRFYLTLLTLLTLAVAPFPTGLSRSLPAAQNPPPQRVTVTGYERDKFGPGWATLDDGCTTRTVAMAHAFDAECATAHRDWRVVSVSDPYTGEPLSPSDVEIDHLVPLSAAWDLGAHRWPDERREAFANNPRNLVVVSGGANREKSDQLPSEWMPPDWRARCAYARQLTGVAEHYSLPLPRPDVRAAKRACSGITALFGRKYLTPPRAPATGI